MKEKATKFFNGFKYAFNGVVAGTEGRNMKVHLLVTFFVIVFGLSVDLANFEWVIVGILIALVISAELMNTAIEELADLIRDHESLEYQATKKARDLAAGSVLVLAAMAAIIGFFIFIPKLL